MRFVAALSWATVLTAWAVVSGCDGRNTADQGDAGSGVKVLLVGIDGATLRVLEPLVAAGELPTFSALLDEGATGVLRSERPMRSPALWTTVATGLPRARHGVEGFQVENPETGEKRVVDATMRTVPAVWDVASASQLEVGVLGWWATWPADRVNGWMVSDRMTRSRWSEWSDGDAQARLTFPEELTERLMPSVVDPGATGATELADVVELTAAEQRRLEAASKPLFGHALSVLRFAWANQRSYERFALELLADGQPDLTALFLIANDAVSHTFWHHWEPHAFGVEPSETTRRLGRAVPGMYRHNDAFLRELLALLEEDTVVVVLSDHGFKASGRLPRPAAEADVEAAFADAEEVLEDGAVAVGQSGKHALDGLFLAAGGPIVKTRVERATLYDVAPTVLALLGLPVSDELPGRVLTEILDPAFLERQPVVRVPSYEDLVRREPGEAVLSPEDESVRDMLRSLGYIQ